MLISKKLFSSAILLCALTAGQALAADNVPTIHGFMATSDEWTDLADAYAQYGFYSFPADGSSGFTPMSSISEDNNWALSGAAYVDGKYYCYTNSGTWRNHTLTFRVIDSATWTIEKSASYTYTYPDKTDPNGQIAERDPADLAYDAINDVIYAATCKYEGDQDTYLCTVDRNTGKTTVIGSIPRIIALTATANGDLLGISIDGDLYSINKDATTTKIGATGFFPSRGLKQSMTIDFKDGQLYWSAMCFASNDDRNYNRNGIFALIKVNPLTGKGEILYNYPRMQRFTAVNILNAHPNSPADVSDLTFTPKAFESKQAVVSCTLPAVTMTDNPISGSLSVSVYVDNSLATTKSAPAGSTFTHEIGPLSDGSHTVCLQVSNQGHDGNRVYASTYIGQDTPAKIAKVTLNTVDGNRSKAVISWQAPTLGSKGAPYDPAKIRYRVVRYPDETVIKRAATETSVTDDIAMEYSRVFYAVTPYNVDRPTEFGETTTSNGMHLGVAMSIPYSQKFDTEREFQSFTTIDANGDAPNGGWEGTCWKWDATYSCAFYYGKPNTPADDWLITPPLNLDPLKLYRLSFKYYGYYGYGNHFQVAVGSAPTVGGMTRVISDINQVTSFYDQPGLDASVLFAPHEGNEFIGFHHLSTTKEHLSIDNILIEEVGDSRIPDLVGALTLKRLSSESAQIDFDIPTTDAAGRTLAGSLTAKIFRNEASEPVYSENVEPGQHITWTDVAAVKGPNTYRVVVTNSFGDGLEASKTIDLSDAIPEMLTNIRARYINERQVELTWDPITSTIGANGNPLDPSEVRYTVYKPINTPEGDTEYRIIAYDLEQPRFVHDNPLLGSEREQQLVYYMVAAVNPAGEGYASASDNIIAGPAYSLPFEETWFQQTQETNPWIKSGLNGADWYIRHKGYDPLADGADGYGLLTCEVNYGYTSGLGTILTPRLDLSSMTRPKVSFQIYRGPEYQDNINFVVGISTDSHPTVTYISDVIFAKADKAGWETVTIDLAKYAKETRASLVFMANVAENNHVHIDNLRVYGSEAANITRPDYITGPSELVEGSTYSFRGYVRNYNPIPASNVEVKLMAGNRQIASTTIPSIPAEGSAYATLEFTPSAEDLGTLTLSLVAGNTANADAIKEVNVAEFNPASVHDLRGTVADGSLLLNWSVPTQAEKAQKATESFETYESFAIDHLGPWTLIDADGFVPFQFSNGNGGTIEWPHYDLPQAFTIYDPEMLPQAPEAWTGAKCLINWGSPYGANNDWLISPELPGNKQVISFFSRAFGQGKEEFQVLASNSDNSPESFVSLSGSSRIAATTDWQYNFFTLPEGTLYFAINYLGNKQDGLMIDDIRFFSFHSYATPDGYNIYRDGVKLNNQLLGSTAFEDTNVNTDETHVYTVRAVYNGNEAADSNEFRTGANAIDNITPDAPLAYSISGNTVTLNDPNAALYNIQGICVLKGCATATLPTGVYILTTPNATLKLAL